MSIADATRRQLRTGATPRPMEATVVDPPVNLRGLLRVRADEQPGYVREVHWQPRLDVGPQPGDAALIVESDRRELWAAAWWPQTGATPLDFAGLFARIADLEAGLAALAAAPFGLPTATLPTSGTPGMPVLWRHTPGVAPWTVIWDPALNGGAGAWAVVGGAPIVAVATAGATTNLPSSYVQTTVSGTPAVTVPKAGLYRIEMSLPVQAQTSGLLDAFWGVRQSPGTLLGWIGYMASTAQYSAPGTIAAVTQPIALPNGGVVSMVGAAGTSSFWGHASGALRTLALHPVELRP